ncbi:uncharacterized protein si:dkey-154b15.1 [Pungitius pungitius]|uniref:uncharacterized protein si:dkey-154b15.1 n=1 Tax=Pungitius pungitius TaxID=134920 RepID=UPI002E0E0A43
MDLPVEATVRLDLFPNEAEVRDILRSHGFALTDVSGDQVRVKGSFWSLKAAKASLEPLLRMQTISPNPEASSGAISKRSADKSSVSRGARGRVQPPPAEPSSPGATASSPVKRPSPPDNSASFSPPPDRRSSFGPRRECVVVDMDVFRYADRLRKKNIEEILFSHNVEMEAQEVGESCVITLLGKGAREASGKLQSLMNDLSISLRTQDVPLEDMDREGHALSTRIQKRRDVYQSVVVWPLNDKLHLIGPSAQSYQLKQRLLGGPVGSTGRTPEMNSKSRSSSLPAQRKNTGGGGGGAMARYQDVKKK